MDIKAALARAPSGSRLLGELLVEIQGTRVHTAAIATPHSVVIPVDTRIEATDERPAGFIRATIEMDHATYDRTISAAKRIGGLPVLQNMLERYTGKQVIAQLEKHADFRPILPR